MKRLDSHVGSLQAALQERPEVLHAISMYAAIYILNRMVYDLVNEVAMQTFVTAHLIGKEFGSEFDMLTDDGLQSFLLPIWNYESANIATALQESHDNGFISETLPHSSDAPSVYVLVHVASFATD